MPFRRKFLPSLAFASVSLLIALVGGCSFFPEVRHRPSLHNPFPQLKQIAVLPFFNQSEEPTVDGEAVALAYYSELQAIPGFEVLPIGVASNLWTQFARVHGEPRSGQEFQQLAQFMGVEAIVVGSVTDFSSYYPPRIAMTTHWYTANPGFHPVPPGYGLPWGTKAEKRIPRRIVEEAEFELAREQLATQSPVPAVPVNVESTNVSQADGELPIPEDDATPRPSPALGPALGPEPGAGALGSGVAYAGEMPATWPDPTGLIPDAPRPTPPALLLQAKPVLSHTRIYRGDDEYVTDRLADYVGNEVDSRSGGWQSYLNRSNDFIRFCCHLHIAEMLESRGGSDQSDLILRWPISRY
jgi:hypothetical protein